jgi:hypothetical protein
LATPPLTLQTSSPEVTSTDSPALEDLLEIDLDMSGLVSSPTERSTVQCRYFNQRGCRYRRKCRHTHTCLLCDGAHSAVKCPRKGMCHFFNSPAGCARPNCPYPHACTVCESLLHGRSSH